MQPLPLATSAADGGAALIWGLPFAALLLSVALLPILAPRLWHRRMGLVALFWGLALLVPQAILFGPGFAAAGAWHAVLTEYLPFISLLAAIYAIGGGVLLAGGPWGTPVGNTLLLALATATAALAGPLAASMVLIHPLLRANAHRPRRVHLVVFFIVLVCNVGGLTTPLGNPPLYIGLLLGVPFLWPMAALWRLLLLLTLPLLAVFWLIDRHLASAAPPPPPPRPLRLRGWGNIALLVLVVAVVLVQSAWRPGETDLFGTRVGLEHLLGAAVFGIAAVISIVATPRAVRRANMFDWAPMREVAKLFAAIFVTITPVLAMLEAGRDGPLGGLLRLATDAAGQPAPAAYFWLAGILSAVLDNAPTYLLFFRLAGGDAAQLTLAPATALMAISAGAVGFGALTYIGNAPNLMVRAIAVHGGVRMPGFFGYMLYASALLLPGFVALTLLFFL